MVLGGQRIGRRYRCATNGDLSGDRGKAGKGADKIALSVALDAGQSHDLAGQDLKLDTLQDLAADVAGRQQRRGLVLPGGLVRENPFHRAPDDQRQNVLLGDAGGVEGAVKAAVAQHADAIGDAAHFRQAMRDVDDGRAFGLDLRDLREQPLGLGRGQSFGRLIEHQYLRLQRQRLGDLDQLALGNGKIADARAAVEMCAEGRQLLIDPRGIVLGVQAPMRRNAVKQVLGDREVVENRGVLIDDADAEGLRQRRRSFGERLPADFDGAGIPGKCARGDRHERGFSGTIFADQRVNFALDHIQTDPAERDDARKGLDHI